MPMLVGELLEERRSAASVNVVTEASSITALTWFSNSTGSTMTLRGTDLEQRRADRHGVRRAFR